MYSCLWPVSRCPLRDLTSALHCTAPTSGTAFCHLLPTAFVSLLDPCLGSDSVFGRYPALAGAIAMGGVFAVTAVELAFAEVHGGSGRHFHHRSDIVDGPVRHPDGTLTPPKDKEPSVASQDGYQSKEEEAKAFMQCMLLEMGILFHSVFIGRFLFFLSLSLSRKHPVTTNDSCVAQAWPSASPVDRPLSSSSSRSFSTVRPLFLLGQSLASVGRPARDSIACVSAAIPVISGA